MKKLLVITITISLLSIGCKKPAGEGGQASIKGKIYVENYNANFTVLNDEYFAQDERVYIIYGDETAVGDDVRTSYDGSFEFPNLRKGSYKVYALSKDSASGAALSKTIEILQEVEITEKKEEITLPTITILN